MNTYLSKYLNLTYFCKSGGDGGNQGEKCQITKRARQKFGGSELRRDQLCQSNGLKEIKNTYLLK